MGRAEDSVSGYLGAQSTINVKASVNHRLAKVSTGGEFYFSRGITNQARRKYQDTVRIHRTLAKNIYCVVAILLKLV